MSTTEERTFPFPIQVFNKYSNPPKWERALCVYIDQNEYAYYVSAFKSIDDLCNYDGAADASISSCNEDYWRECKDIEGIKRNVIIFYKNIERNVFSLSQIYKQFERYNKVNEFVEVSLETTPNVDVKSIKIHYKKYNRNSLKTDNPYIEHEYSMSVGLVNIAKPISDQDDSFYEFFDKFIFNDFDFKNN